MLTNQIVGENPIQQQAGDTCAIKSQQLIMQQFGIPATEEQLVQRALDLGIYTSDGTTGTSAQHVGILLDDAGIAINQTPNATIFDLTNELAQGHKVIVGVDSGELWARDRGLWEQFKEWWEDLWGNEIADHALIVTSIDNTNPNDPRVVLTDPGSGEIRHYPLEQFMNAWRDSSCFMVSTDIAPAEFAANQILNNRPSLHLSDIAGVNYDDFQLFHDMSDALPHMNGWDYTSNPCHPVHSLMDAYFQYGQDAIGFGDFNHFDFYPHLDPALFSTNFTETYNLGFNQLYQDFQFEMSGMQNFLAFNHDMNTMCDYFNTQALTFDNAGNTELADFFHQQVNYMDLCDGLDINPMDTYTLF